MPVRARLFVKRCKKDRQNRKDVYFFTASKLQRVKLGNFGDCDPIDDGLWEFRIHAGPGFRIYYAIVGKFVILITGGGIKRTQKRDIKQALMYLEEYRKTKK